MLRVNKLQPYIVILADKAHVTLWVLCDRIGNTVIVLTLYKIKCGPALDWIISFVKLDLVIHKNTWKP